MNYVLVVIDSLDYTRVQNSPFELLPFLSRKGKSGISASNMYSEAPYTEAAVMALYGGQHTLSNHGYLKRYANIPQVIFEAIKDSGYDVYSNELQPQCYPTSLRRGVTDLYYNRGFDVSVLWSYRFSHYSELYAKRELDEEDFDQLADILNDNFDDWNHFLIELEKKDRSTEIIYDLNKKYDARAVKEQVDEQIRQFEKSHKEYIVDVLTQGKNHPIFSIPYFEQCDHEISTKARKAIDERSRRIIKRMSRMNFSYNLFHNYEIYGSSLKAVREFIKNHNKTDFMNSMYLVKNTLLPVHMKERYGDKAPSFKGQPSFNTLSKHLLKWVDEREGNKPFFACLHVDDIHFPEVFYTYDTGDLDIVNGDLDVAERFLNENRAKRPGSILHDLSLLFADHQCECLYNEFRKRGLISDTVFIVTADHGFSYSGYPIRCKAINTFYLENFKIPFFIFGPGITEQKYDNILSSTSIPATICDLMNISGESFEPKISREGNQIGRIEYCGGGCPDLRRREIMLAAFNCEKMVAFKSSLRKDFSLDNITEVYNLVNDPEQRTNIAKTYKQSEYMFLINEIEKRFNEIKREEIKLG